ncbi:alpha/beta fold hydrolase [Luteimonas terricola]|uniref:Proline iminopeptidase n=1 Tax=Luteimonas terricola TaxID=645597 RepID=A0ABQ2EBQ4_9GAMM|nr:alpha/beta hydrolase [Luteimonas terricola]GGK05069.1 proline iminopeptidase [Luteimonas terricola]
MQSIAHTRYPAAVLLALLLGFATTASAAPSPPADEPYADAKRILADLQQVVTPDGVQALEQVRLGGIDQWISVRGADRDNPILLYLHGGPAQPMMPASWTFQRAWEDYFTVVQWDQRASGKTHLANDPAAVADTIHIERYVDDALELIALLRERFGKDRVVVMGHSWGTIIGMEVLLRRPEWLHVYVGLGQIISVKENETLGYDYALRRARAEDNREAVAELEALAPYPGSEPLHRDRIGTQRKWSIHYGGLSGYRSNADQYFAAQRLSPDYSEADRRAIHEGSMLTLDRIMAEWNAVDFRAVRKVGAPVVMFMGRHDYTTPSQQAADWVARVEAPGKDAVWFEHSAHLAPLEEPGRVLMALVDRVRPFAVAKGDGAPAR